MNAVIDTPSTNQAPAPLDVASVRADFAYLRAGHDASRDLAYLDSAATTQKPRQVLDALRATYESRYANVHRGVYHLAAEATAAFEAAREKVRNFINATSPREIIYTRGTTEAINLVARSYGAAHLSPGDIVLTTELEHHSNLVPWQQIAAERGAHIRYIPVSDDGELQLDALDELAAGGALKIVAVGHVSNALGTVNPVREIATWAHERGAVVLVDGAQAAPHQPIDVQELGCDFYAFSGHKLLGPTGIGVLWGREEILRDMPPYQYGGEMIRQVRLEGTTFNDLPWKFEAGTPAFVEAIGLGAAIDYLQALTMEAVHDHERHLTAYGYERLAALPGVTILGPQAQQPRGGILSFVMEGTHPHDIASMLDERDVCIRAGHHCAQPVMRRLSIGATARASVYIYNTTDDIDRLIDGLGEVQRVFGV